MEIPRCLAVAAPGSISALQRDLLRKMMKYLYCSPEVEPRYLHWVMKSERLNGGRRLSFEVQSPDWNTKFSFCRTLKSMHRAEAKAKVWADKLDLKLEHRTLTSWKAIDIALEPHTVSININNMCRNATTSPSLTCSRKGVEAGF